MYLLLVDGGGIFGMNGEFAYHRKLKGNKYKIFSQKSSLHSQWAK